MADKLILQFVTLSIFSFLMGTTFCDFFKLHVVRKLIWFTIFFAISAFVMHLRGEYDLTLILPVPMLLAIVLGRLQIRRR